MSQYHEEQLQDIDYCVEHEGCQFVVIKITNGLHQTNHMNLTLDAYKKIRQILIDMEN